MGVLLSTEKFALSAIKSLVRHVKAALFRTDFADTTVAANGQLVLARGSVPGIGGTKDVMRAHTEAEVRSTDALLKVYQRRAEDGVVDIDLVIATIQHIVTVHAAVDGAVLVFLPGWDDITRIRELLISHPVR